MIHLIIFIPLLFALIGLALRGQARATLSIFAAFSSFALTAVVWIAKIDTPFRTPWIPGAGVFYSVSFDGASLLLALVASLMTAITLIYFSSRKDSHQADGIYPLVLVMLTGLLGIFAARDLILFYVFFEATLVPSLFMLGLFGRKNRVRALTKMALYTIFGGLLMLVSIIGTKLYTNSPSFDFLELLGRTSQLDLETQTWLFLGFLAAFAVKLPLFPLHNWLPDFHAENHPSGVADVMGTLYKVGGYGLFRFAIPLFPAAAQNLQWILMFLAALTALYGAWIAFSSKDFKRLLAYAGLSHMGLVALGLFSLNPIGMAGALYLLAFQGVYSSALFLIVGMLEERLNVDSKNEKSTNLALEIGHVRGLAASAPAFAGVALVLWFASIGVPGLAGFIGEFSIFLGAYQANPWATALAVATVIASAAFALTAYQRTWLEESSSSIPELHARDWVVLAPILAVTVFFGVFSSPALKLLEPSVQAVAGLLGGK
jgi:NADH-quinone oxidoreductase subunit M